MCAGRDSHSWLLRPCPWTGHEDRMRIDDDALRMVTLTFSSKSKSSSAATGDCELGPSWLLWLCVVFGVLFLVSLSSVLIPDHHSHHRSARSTNRNNQPFHQVMLCVNVFLCSAMTCSFSRAEVEFVKKFICLNVIFLSTFNVKFKFKYVKLSASFV